MGYTPSKLKHNPREKEIQEDLMNQGWNVLYKGWPDFLFYKEENGKIVAFFVEVKRKGKEFSNTYATKLSPEQKKMHYVLKKLGLDIKVILKE